MLKILVDESSGRKLFQCLLDAQSVPYHKWRGYQTL